MDYEKKYKNLLAKAKEFEFQGYIDEECLYDMFPELREESEDKRIRKDIIYLVKYWWDIVNKDNISTKEQMLAWLEKQGKNNMGISEATKQELEDNLNKALEKETPESLNEFLDKQGEQNPDKIVEKAKTEKQRVLLTETDGTANIDWDCRSLDDVKILLKCGLEFIRTIEANKQILADNRFGGCSFRVPTRYDKGIKQGEQKPVIEMKTPEESLDIDSDTYNKIVDECIYGEQKPAWSEEDTQYINDTLALLSFGCSTHSVGEVKEWLQSLNEKVKE